MSNDIVSHPEVNLKNLSAKMIKIMSEVGYIHKKGYNEFHDYKYAGDSEVSAAFSKAMKNHNVFMYSSILERTCQAYERRGGKNSFLITVKLEVTFVDVDSGESKVCIFYGDGSDSDDKGVFKAITGAQKYALMKTFLVETGDDPEREKMQMEPKAVEKLKEEMRGNAAKGTAVLKNTWGNLSGAEKKALQGDMEEIKEMAKQVDNKRPEEEKIGETD